MPPPPPQELSKGGLPHRAAELFDWLRSLPGDDPLARLADLYTYTTIISQVGGWCAHCIFLIM